MKRFEDKVALVTGGRSGIGQAIARRLQDEGATVMTVQRGADEEFDGITADLFDPHAPEQIIADVIARAGRLDVLVNNAGVMQEAGIEEMDLQDWQRNIALNLTAPFLLIRAALPHLCKTQGNIVNTGSVEGLGSNPGHAAYSAAKAGLHGLTRAVAVDHGHKGIRCNAVAPGWIDTDLNLDFIESRPDPDAFRREIRRIHPLDITGTPKEVAALVAFLAAQEAGFITGQVYTVDGGRMVKLSLPWRRIHLGLMPISQTSRKLPSSTKHFEEAAAALKALRPTQSRPCRQPRLTEKASTPVVGNAGGRASSCRRRSVTLCWSISDIETTSAGRCWTARRAVSTISHTFHSDS